MVTITTGYHCDYPACGRTAVAKTSAPDLGALDAEIELPAGWAMVRRHDGQSLLICPSHEIVMDGKGFAIRPVMGFTPPEIERRTEPGV